MLGDGHAGLGVGSKGHDIGICWFNALSSNSCQNRVCKRAAVDVALDSVEDGSKLRVVICCLHCKEPDKVILRGGVVNVHTLLGMIGQLRVVIDSLGSTIQKSS